MAEIAEIALQGTIAELITTKTEDGSVVISPFAKRLMDTRLAPIIHKYNDLIKLRGESGIPKDLEEAFIEEYTEARDRAVDVIIQTEDFRNLRYQKSYEALKRADKEGIERWGDLLTEIHQDDDSLNEIFVRLVEEQENIKITSAKQLQEVTGITEIWSYWKGGESIEYPDTKEGRKQAKAEAKKEMEETFGQAMEFRYRNLLEAMLKTGAMYKDLLSIEPSQFHLPAEKQSEVIRMTLALYFNLIEAPFFRPDLKTIAEEIEAPYSVLMDCLITERITASDNAEKNVVDKKEDIERTLKQKVEAYIDRQPAAWKKEHLMTASKSWSQERADLQRSQYLDSYVTWFNTVVWDELKLLSNPGDHEKKVVEIHKPTILKEFKDVYEAAINFYSPVANNESHGEQ